MIKALPPNETTIEFAVYMGGEVSTRVVPLDKITGLGDYWFRYTDYYDMRYMSRITDPHHIKELLKGE